MAKPGHAVLETPLQQPCSRHVVVDAANHGRRNRGVGDNVPVLPRYRAGPKSGVRNVPHFWDQRGTGSTGGGPMKMIFASTADSLY